MQKSPAATLPIKNFLSPTNWWQGYISPSGVTARYSHPAPQPDILLLHTELERSIIKWKKLNQLPSSRLLMYSFASFSYWLKIQGKSSFLWNNPPRASDNRFNGYLLKPFVCQMQNILAKIKVVACKGSSHIIIVLVS